jgi:hypothetical protein
MPNFTTFTSSSQSSFTSSDNRACSACDATGIDTVYGGACPNGCEAPVTVTTAPSSSVLEARCVQLNPLRRQGADLEALKVEIRANIEANPRAKRVASKNFNGLEMATAGRQVSFIRGSQAITFFIRQGGAVVILSEPKHRAFFPAMERHIEATMAAIVAKINRAVAA